MKTAAKSKEFNQVKFDVLSTIEMNHARGKGLSATTIGEDQTISRPRI
jgi:hypothetical protein